MPINTPSGVVMLTPTELRELLAREYGADSVVRVCLEPNAVMEGKVSEGAENSLWIFDPATMSLGRGDGRFLRADYVMRDEGFGQVRIYEEPNVDAPSDGSPRVVGTVYLLVNSRGYVKVRDNKGLNGPILEANPTSVSKGEILPTGARVTRRMYVEMNPQRLDGVVEIVVVYHDFPDEEGMSGRQAINVTTDARLICAVAASGTL